MGEVAPKSPQQGAVTGAYAGLSLSKRLMHGSSQDCISCRATVLIDRC